MKVVYNTRTRPDGSTLSLVANADHTAIALLDSRLPDRPIEWGDKGDVLLTWARNFFRRERP